MATLTCTLDRFNDVLRALEHISWTLKQQLLCIKFIRERFLYRPLYVDAFIRAAFATEMLIHLAAARHQISIQHVRFDGSPSFTEEGEEYVPEHPGKPRYVGEPSDEVDEAWNQITKGVSRTPN